MQYKYDHALERMWDLFVFGRDREKTLEAKILQIKYICERNSTDAYDRIDEVLELIADDRNGVGV
jgi:hypothetical protein